MGQCCGMEKRISMNEIQVDANGANANDSNNPYLESKNSRRSSQNREDKIPVIVNAKSLYDSDAAGNEEIKSTALKDMQRKINQAAAEDYGNT